MMSRFGSAVCFLPPVAYGLLLQRVFVDDHVLRKARVGDADGAEEGQQRRRRAAAASSAPPPAPAPTRGSRKSKKFQHRMPSTLSASCFRRPSVPRRTASCRLRRCRSRSANRSSMRILQPRRSPKNATFEPTTGPRSSRTGSFARRQAAEKFAERLGRKRLAVVCERGGRRCRLVPIFAGIPEQRS